MTLAVVGAVVGEFVGSNSGIGYVLQRSIGNFELPTMFAALVDAVAHRRDPVLDRRHGRALLMPWHASQRHEIYATA